MIVIDMPVHCVECGSPMLEAVTRRITPVSSKVPYSKNDPSHQTMTNFHCLKCGFNWPKETVSGG